MRVGQNPAKSIDHVPQPARVTVAVVSYIPFLNGYYQHSLEVLKTCLESLWAHTELPYDLLVFDNASCPETRSFLLQAHQEGRIQYLVLSDRNVGKGGAWNFIFQGAPGEFIAYADSDIYFAPGWLARSLEIFEAFPNTGMVTARPLRTPAALYNRTLEWAEQQPDVTIETGSFTPWEVYLQHVLSLGTSEEQAREWYQSRQDWRLTRAGVSAQVSAAHFQFTVRKALIQQFLPFEMDRPMGQVRSLDQQVNEAGYLRLSTCEPLVRHMGNQVEGAVISQAKPARPKKADLGKRLAGLPGIRSGLLKIYDAIFKLYYE